MNAIRALWAAALTRPGLALIALAVSTGGAAVLTIMLFWTMRYLKEAAKADQLFYLGAGMLLLIGLVLLGTGRLLAGKQAIEVELWKLKAKLTQDDAD